MNKLVSFTVAIFYVLAPSYLSFAYWLVFHVAFAWFPVILGLYVISMRCGADRKTFLYVALGALSVGMCTLASGAQSSIMMLYAVGFYYLYDVWKHRNNRKHIIHNTIKTFMFCGLGLLFAAPTLLSMQQFIGSSIRFTTEGPLTGFENFTFNEFTAFPFPIENIFAFFTASYRQPIYFAALPAVLCILAFFLPKKEPSLYFKILFVVIFLACFNIVSPLFLYRVPMLNRVRQLFMFKYYLNLAVPVLAGYTLQWVYDKLSEKSVKNLQEQDSGTPKLRIVAPPAVMVIFTVALYSVMPDKNLLIAGLFITIIVVVICIIDNQKVNIGIKWTFIPTVMIIFIININSINNKHQYSGAQTIVDYFNTAQEIAEFFTPEIGEELFRMHTTYDENSPIGQGHSAIFGFNSAFGYSNPITESAFHTYLYLPLNIYSDLLNIRYYTSTVENIGDYSRIPEDTSDFIYVGAFDNIYNTSMELVTAHVYEKVNRPGHAWFVDEYKYYNNAEDGLSLLITNQVDLKYEALVQDDFTEPENNEIALDARADIIEYRANRIVIETQSNKDALLVVSEYNYPGWRVSINGKSANIEEVNVYLRGVVVPKGGNTIKLTYFPNSLIIGLICSSFSLLSMAVLVIISIRSYRSFSQPPQ
ncbi:MAG: YfhO family protein [Oscillospiraceae bacterium]|nr:YfhO family protein [Oscillospiraceae bacterium]